MNQIPIIGNILLLFLVSVALASCNLFNSDSGQSDVIKTVLFIIL